ncbi:hypothetical protein [Bordetella genomosp. 13]|uniref:hypothetical protein n=1 Tax=Bordetella genomosp. 13 TaxID=463040 RepID=UPI0011A96768|nr:hypothetical protein [Bordetella genomosp. 13]
MAVTDTALDLWDRLCVEAGLEPRSTRGRPGRDADLEDALLALFQADAAAPPKACRRLRDLLQWDGRSATPRIAAAHFLRTVLASQRDFAVMMEDILDALDRGHAGRDPRIAFRFGPGDAPMNLSLAQLRAQVREIRQVLEIRAMPPWQAADTPDPEVADTYAGLLGILILPIWRKRHAMYSVWAGAMLLRTAQRHADSFHFHATAGTLTFAAGGYRLATYEYGQDQFDIWAELRSAAAGGRRKRGIQPDFRVVRARLDGRDEAATRLALECRHHLTGNASNVAHAAEGYARSCPDADTFLVDREPADRVCPITKAAATTAARIRFIGHATPSRERQHPMLQAALRDALFEGAAHEAVPLRAARSRAARSAAADLQDAPRSGIAATVVLEWTEALQDVDLRLALIHGDRNEHTVAFDHTGSLAEAPYAQLVQDVVTGPGREVIEISRWGNASYLISVRNFSQTGALAPDNVACRVQIHGGPTWLLKPSHARDYEWTVGTITVVGADIHMVPYAGETVLSS